MLRYIGIDGVTPLSSYNLLLGVGMIAFFLTLEWAFRKNATSIEERDGVYLAALFAGGFAVVGAALVEMVCHRMETGWNFAGFTFYGGLLAGMAGLMLFAWQWKQGLLYLANLLAPSLTLAHAFGRIGCFLGGCCYGKPAHVVVGFVFPAGSLPFGHYGATSLYPVQLYESLALFLLFVLLQRVGFASRAAFYLLAYPAIRFVLEYYRGDNRGMLVSSFLSPAQEISLVLFAVGVALWRNRRTI